MFSICEVNMNVVHCVGIRLKIACSDNNLQQSDTFCKLQMLQKFLYEASRSPSPKGTFTSVGTGGGNFTQG